MSFLPKKKSKTCIIVGNVVLDLNTIHKLVLVRDEHRGTCSISASHEDSALPTDKSSVCYTDLPVPTARNVLEKFCLYRMGDIDIADLRSAFDDATKRMEKVLEARDALLRRIMDDVDYL